MTTIFCTKKLEKLIGKEHIGEVASENTPLGNWNAHVFPIQGRKCLILVNDQTYYPLLFIDILKKDMLNFHDLFFERFVKQIQFDGINFEPAFIFKMKAALNPTFHRTNNNRKVLGTINEFIFATEIYIQGNYDELSELNPSELNHLLTRTPIGALMAQKNKFGYSIEEMQRKIREAKFL